MRSNATKQENHLWYDFLRAYPVRCHRQKIIGEYIVDFYCPQAKLIIELDGQHHLERNQAEYDEERTKYLNAGGYRVIRFSNAMVEAQFATVCERIDQEIRQRVAIKSSPRPSATPLANEGGLGAVPQCKAVEEAGKAPFAREGGGPQGRGEQKRGDTQ